MNKPALLIDWATYPAAKYACEHWHYSQSVPVGKLAKVGAWEDNQFIGVVLFSYGANNNIGRPYGLSQTECCELTRVALREHQTPVSQIMMQAIRMLKKQSQGLRLIVSYADSSHGHHGGIYQATNWIYQGPIFEKSMAVYQGKVAHRRTFDMLGIKGYLRMETKAKHKYLMPLDSPMKKQLLPLAKPYPKRTSQQEAT